VSTRWQISPRACPVTLRLCRAHQGSLFWSKSAL
jgi:hypothetical protein